MGAITPVIVLLIGVATGFLDSTVGNGGSISIPFLIFIGLPPQVAIATDRLGTVGQSSASLFRFWNSGKILWKYVPFFVILSLIATSIGANILVSFNPVILQKLVAVVLLILLPLTFVKHNLDLKEFKVSYLKKGAGFVIYFALMILNGFLGIGSGTILYYTFLFLFGFTMIESNATNKLPEFLLSILSLIIFFQHGIVDLRNGIFLMLGMAIGGYLGAHTALKKVELWVKRLFVVVVVASGIKLLLF